MAPVQFGPTQAQTTYPARGSHLPKPGGFGRRVGSLRSAMIGIWYGDLQPKLFGRLQSAVRLRPNPEATFDGILSGWPVIQAQCEGAPVRRTATGHA
jgi:hypothetical protein